MADFYMINVFFTLLPISVHLLFGCKMGIFSERIPKTSRVQYNSALNAISNSVFSGSFLYALMIFA